jgi:predicted nuclease with TOPRIM domain
LNKALRKVEDQRETLHRIRDERSALRRDNKTLEDELANAQKAYTQVHDALNRIKSGEWDSSDDERDSANR